MHQSYHLEKKFHGLLAQCPELFDWFTEDTLDGLWYSDISAPTHYWFNKSFWNILGYDNVERKSLSDSEIKTITENPGITDLITRITKEKVKEGRACISFIDRHQKTVTLDATALLLDAGLLIKFIKRAQENDLVSSLKSEIQKLQNFNGIYEETNEIAHVGGWEADLVSGTISWTKLTRDIHEVPADFEPDLAEGINFYKEGWSRELITELFTKAVEKGESFDAELKLITAKGREIWVRSFGRPEMELGKCVRVYGAFQDIDAKKKQELALAKSKESFEKIFTNSSIGIILVNRDNELLMLNPASLRIFGFEEDDRQKVLNLNYRDMVHPDHIQKAVTLRKKLLEGEIQSYKKESRFITAAGKTIWCSVSTSMIQGQDREDDLIITQIEDITGRKELENRAQENADRFENAFENSPNGMGVVSLEGNWIMINKNLAAMIGFEKHELLQLDLKNVTHPDDVLNDKLQLRQIILGEIESYSIEKRYIHKDGHIVYGYLNVSVLKDINGNPASLIGQVVDMSASIKSQRALRRSLNDLQSVMDATTQIAIIETDLKGTVRKFNKGAENLLGYTASETIGTHKANIFHDEKEIEIRGKQLSKTYKRNIEGFDVFVYKARLGNFESSEWTYIKKDGTRFKVQLVVTPVKNHRGKIAGYLGVATDITKLKEMEDSLIKAKLKAEMASISKSEFLANMSHEIRTPLNGVIGFTDLLMRSKLSESQSRYMLTVYNSATSLLDLINDILDFSKIEAGKLEINEEKTDLRELCGQTIDIIKHQAHSKGLEILLNISPEAKRFVYADSVRLRQIITNLLGNAVKFTEKGEVELKIEASPKPDDRKDMEYLFSIRDTGIGIAPNNLNKIFHAFDQEDGSTTRKYGGTGLGVTISNKLLGLMGSKLQVNSTLGKGSTFSFKVDFKTEKDSLARMPRGRKDIKKVLIVDDNAPNRTIVQEMFAVDNIESEGFANAIDAIERLGEGNDFDLAVIDYHMPYMTGLDLIKHIRKDLGLRKKELPIILLHSSGDDELIFKSCKKYKIDFNLVKPIQINKLFDCIEKLGQTEIKGEEANMYKKPDDLFLLTPRIMIAEDNPVNKFLSKTIIAKIVPKATIIEVDNGKEAVKSYHKERPDLIFMDIQMPVMSGFEATQIIRENEQPEVHVPIVALTARALNGERERCLESGMDDYLTKPVVLENIRNIITQYLANLKSRELQNS